MEAQLPATPSVAIIVEIGSAMQIASVDANLQQLVDVEVEVSWVRKPTCGEADVHKGVLHSFTLNIQPEDSSCKLIGFFGLERSLRCIQIHGWCR